MNGDPTTYFPMTLRNPGARVTVRLINGEEVTGKIKTVDYVKRSVTLRIGRRFRTIDVSDVTSVSTGRPAADHVRIAGTTDQAGSR